MDRKSKKSITQDEFEIAMKKVTESYEKSLSEQRDRIELLKKENENLKEENEKTKMQIKPFSETITELSKKLKTLTKESDIVKINQIEKVKSFAIRWKTYLKQYYEDGDISVDIKDSFIEEVDELIAQFIECNNLKKTYTDKSLPRFTEKSSISDFIPKEEVEQNHKDEFAMTENSKLKFDDIMKKLKNQMVFKAELNSPSDAGFDIGEAINPTDSLNKILDDIL